jgi:hypothetical protein
MTNNFWTSTQVEPKRKYRFTVEITGTREAGVLWFAKGINKPEITVESQEHSYLNHKFHFPGTVTWNEVSVTLVDPVSPDAASITAEMLTRSGYAGPSQLKGENPSTISKSKASNAVGQVKITQIDSEGKPLETWTLKNAFIVKVAYGELEYGDDALSEVTIDFKYDWAELQVASDEYWKN